MWRFGRWRLQSNDFFNFTTPILSSVELRKIAEYFDEKCFEIDRLITNKEELFAVLENYKNHLFMIMLQERKR